MPPHKNNRISQQQIARELGVSQALVSMVLNGRRSGISQESFDRIWKYALEHGYTPRGMKVDLARPPDNTHRTVGYILRAPLQLATKSNFFSYVHHGLHDKLTEADIRTVFLGGETDLNADQLVEFIDSQPSLIGLVVMGELDEAFMKTLLRVRKPVVYTSARYPGRCHSVISNQTQSANQLVEHLIHLGHRSFAWLGGDEGRSRNRDRKNAVLEALARHGLGIESKAQVDLSDADRREGTQAAAAIFRSNRRQLPTAWICMTGLMARGAINLLLQNQIRVGRDVSVAAFDLTRVCTEEHPTITSAFAEPTKVGEEAGRIVLAASEDPSYPLHEITLPSVLEVRESTGAPPPVRVKKALPAKSKTA